MSQTNTDTVNGEGAESRGAWPREVGGDSAIFQTTAVNHPDLNIWIYVQRPMKSSGVPQGSNHGTAEFSFYALLSVV